jgi:hypothetical protein
MKKYATEQSILYEHGSTAMLSERLTNLVSNVRSEVEYLIVCFLAGGGEVKMRTTTTSKFVAVPRHLLTFPKRYLRCINKSQ